ncbi:exodeoxyribonuclease III [Alkalimarinus coralli]|uniref:exodeoxyribonuclease III n=1 Tax=Alkalimarinus coralli TaxID=2935863 RepID=UPI00202B074C|nr:exodeoxyribonuclease III [Alkalimarinus coralli]
MKIVSFNVNGLRSRLHQLEHLASTYSPDIIGLQETKVHDPEFPLSDVESLGYHVEFWGQKGHYGVALLSKQKPTKIMKGFPSDNEEDQKRLIVGHFEVNGQELAVINGYFPQGESRDHPTKFPAKKKFYEDLQHLLTEQYSNTQNVIVMGDLNISPEDIDIGIGPDNAKRWLRTGKCSFLPEEREWLERMKSWGLEDSYRKLYPTEAELYSWFDYRSKGFDREPKRGLRIDQIWATPPLISTLTASGIYYDIRGMEKPSDHCPIWSDFNL